MISFERLQQKISTEPSLLHASVDAMKDSYNKGLAVARPDGDKNAIGYARFIPLLSREQIQTLGLPSSFPDIYELGTVFVDPIYRGQGLSDKVQRDLLLLMKERLDNKSLLVLATTKTRKVLRTIDRISKEEGIPFYFSPHTEFPHVSPTTCVCHPTFGEGFQYTTACPQRITLGEMNEVKSTLRINKEDDKIHCTMLVSDRALTQEMDKTIEKAMNEGGQRRLVRKLKQLNYYD